MKQRVGLIVIAVFSLALSLSGQNSSNSAASIAVPPVIQFSNVATEATGAPRTGTVPITFSLYNNARGGEALWSETQNVSADSTGHYSVYLGITKANGLPASLFTTGEAHWLGVRIASQPEEPRVFLVSVPYAMKAGDAATVGGLPPSAFVLTAPSGSASAGSGSHTNSVTPGPNVGGSGTQDYIPLWTDNSGDLGNSILYQSGTAAVGIGTNTPASTLDVNGSVTARGPLQLPATGTANATQGYNSQPLQVQGSAFNGSKAIGPLFQLQTEPTGNNTAGAAGTLNLLYSNGSGQPTETGLNIASNGLMTFVKTQTFPNTVQGITAGNSGITIGGTKTNPTIGINVTFANQNYAQLKAPNTFTANQTVNGTVAATNFSGNGSGLTNVNATELGGLSASAFAQLGASSNTFTGNITASSFSGSGSGLTNVNAAALGGLPPSAYQPAGSYATLSANTFAGTQTVSSGDLSVGNGNLLLPENNGSGSQGVIVMGGNSFIHACCAITSYNTFVGVQAGTLNQQAANNTAEGAFSLASLTQGQSNTASGFNALGSDNTGSSNAGFGVAALEFTSSGANNTALGVQAGVSGNNTNANTTGSNNTFVGYQSGPGTATQLTNATAIGANSIVSENNALVLGSIAGLNNATANANVGIGTASPAYSLDVHGTGNFTGLVTFAPSQTFPGTGTITGVTPGTDLTGGGNSGNVTLNVDTTKVMTGIVAGTDLTGGGSGGVQTLNLDTTKVPQLAAANTFTGNQTVNGNLSATGVMSGSSFQIGSNLFAFGSYSNSNAFLGFAGNPSSTGTLNTAVGAEALVSDTSGGANTAVGLATLEANSSGVGNTAIGYVSLASNTTAGDNTAVGDLSMLATTTGGFNTGVGNSAMYSNTTGTSNTGLGSNAIAVNTTGSYNTGVGQSAGYTTNDSYSTGSSDTFIGAFTTPGTQTNLTNATAIGAYAEVTQNNALVLGGINGVNGANADTTVGIGTTSPIFSGLPDNSTTTLNVVGNSTYVPLVVQSPSTFGTWMLLNNSSSGGRRWAFLSTASGNGEGAGNLAITSLGAGGTIILEGNVQVTGNLSKGGGSFQIDHPLDPANKYLYHSFVESPDMMNVYNGNVTTDKNGVAVVVLPNYFEALNRDFRYQLTVIGQFAQAIVAKEIGNNRFTIKTNHPGVKVSWQVTGIRHDAYADAHRIPVEVDKPAQEQGHYLHPELFGSPALATRSRPPAASDSGALASAGELTVAEQ